jgi:hypothetical protein
MRLISWNHHRGSEQLGLVGVGGGGGQIFIILSSFSFIKYFFY